MTTFLIYLVLILGIVALVQLVRVSEISNFLNGDDGIVVTDKETNSLSYGLVIFIFGYFAFYAWLVWRFWDILLPESASEHGVAVDTLFNLNMLVITISFVITHLVMAFLVFRYAKTRNKVATFKSHDNTLELIWTIVPTMILGVLIVYGINIWNSAMRVVPEDSINIELYARQFDWTARYAGKDNILGKANFRMINGTNTLGIISKNSIDSRLAAYDTDILELEESRASVFPGGANDEEILDVIALRKKHKGYVMQLKANSEVEDYSVADDDILVKVEFHIPINKPVNFQIRSQDVIHSAYMPHFRAQMNAVPGMMTQFYFTPTITTAEMRTKLGNPEFNYLLFCNKICGSAHYNMQMNIVVESEEDYQKWLSEQPKFYTAGNK
mgnify:FL=1|tara:strand:- start:87 stop:1241 length:1155 start_codon:yes stop_codon:yes gene_type:complete